jgi:hypothetical protein
MLSVSPFNEPLCVEIEDPLDAIEGFAGNLVFGDRRFEEPYCSNPAQRG